MPDSFAECYLTEIRQRFAQQKQLAERAAAQIDDASFFAALDSEANSVALLMKHIGGNLRSRWSEVFTTDGEKPDRDRDAEFERAERETRASIMEIWARG